MKIFHLISKILPKVNFAGRNIWSIKFLEFNIKYESVELLETQVLTQFVELTKSYL